MSGPVSPCGEQNEPQSLAWPSFRWSDWSAVEFATLAQSARLGHTIAVLPVAATEQHGPHLPLSVDSAIADAIVNASIARLEALQNQLPKQLEKVPSALFLPTQTIGYSPEHQSFKGTLSLEPTTIINVWLEIGACIAKTGIRKLVLFNSHGGNVGVMDMVARQLRVRHGMLVYSSSWNQLPLSDAAMAAFSAHEQRFGVHAGDLETSMMLHIAPHLVNMAKAKNFASSSEKRAQQFAVLGNGKSAKMGWQMSDYNEQGAAGNAQAATAEKGRLLLDSAAEQLVLLLAELSQVEWTTGSPSSAC